MNWMTITWPMVAAACLMPVLLMQTDDLAEWWMVTHLPLQSA